MGKTPQSRPDVPWKRHQEIPEPQIRDAAGQYERAFKLLATQPWEAVEILPLMNTAAVAVELYLKCLSAEQIYVEDWLDSEGSRVYPEAKRVHGLVELLNAIPPKVLRQLNDEFDADIGACWKKDLESVLKDLEGVFTATRYPFEFDADITCYDHGHLMRLADFLGRFAKNLSITLYIELKS